MYCLAYWVALFALLSGPVAGQSPGTVKVDDSYSYRIDNPSGIQYLPSKDSWLTSPVDASQRYNGTVHMSTAGNARVVFFFQGTGIFYYGDKGPGYGSVQINVDGQRDVYGSVNASSDKIEYQQPLWNITGLGPGDHQLVITRQANSGTGPISLDYFSVVPSNDKIIPTLSGPGASSVPAEALIVDNTDSRVFYSGEWNVGQSSDANAGFYNNTLHATTTRGSIATFTFNGTAVWYFSDIDVTHGIIDISVDGGPPESVSGYHDPIFCQRPVWSKAGLAPGEHRVTITHNDDVNKWATVDFFRYLPNNATEGSGLSGGKGSAQPLDKTNSKAPMAAIIGGVIGGLVGLVGILYAAFLVYRRRARVRRGADWDIEPAPEMADSIQPYESTPLVASYMERAAVRVHGASGKSSNHAVLARHHAGNSTVSEMSTFSSTSPPRTSGRYRRQDPPPYQ